MKTKHTLITLAVFCLALIVAPSFARAETFKVATSTYPGWMDNWLMEMKLNGPKEPSFLEKRTKESGTKVEIKKFPLYIPSVEALVSGEVDACTMAIQEAITIVADKGVEAVVIFPHDYSNGNDQIQIPKSWTEADIKGKEFLLEELSVSNYLLYRYLQSKGLPLKDYVTIKNTPGDNVAPAYIAALENKPVGGVTWNPGCQRMIETGKSKVLFSSRDIPAEITDVLVVRKDRIAGREKAIAAYVAAHFDVMDYLTNPATRDRAIKAMASAAGFDISKPSEVSNYAKMLDATRFYVNRKDALAGMENPALLKANETVRAFYKTYAEPNPDAPAVTFDSSFLK
jgi:NitT/TauT family transport system substrate-binding protein